MKKFLTLFLSLSLLILQGQVMDRTVEDCNSNSKSIYNALSSGKALIVASKGFDCSICVNRAPGWGTWSTANKQQVEVWGAMTNTYSSATPSCNMVNTWISTHGWADIYTFIDSSQYFFATGTPRYLVYSPVDSSLIYQGGSDSQARTLALNASQTGLSLSQNSVLESISFFINARSVHFSSMPAENILVEIYNLTGQKEKVRNLSKDNAVLPLNDLAKGIYLMRLSSKGQAITRKIVLS
jgi:hypothetical protein